MIQAILWDNDGTLVDTEPLYFQATREALAAVGVELTEQLYVRISLGEGRSMFDLAIERGVSAGDVERLREERNARYAELLDAGVPVRPGICECLSALAGQVRMGIVTSSMRDHFTRMHAETALLSYFDFVLTREDFERTKPAPDSYLTAAARHALDPARCLAIEDSLRGVVAAKRAGMQCWVLPTSLMPPAGFPEADRVLSSARELQDEVLALLASE
jgi:HAD superfamily hydrolase (TIGR01509 family)